MSLQKEIEDLLSRYSKENDSNTPDFILASYLIQCLDAFQIATVRRDQWWGNRSLKGINEQG